VLSAAFTVGLFIAGSFSSDILTLSQAVKVPWLEWATRVVYYALPNFRNFNVISSVAHEHPVPLELVLYNTAYAAIYIGLVVAAGMLIFQNRDLK
jgi:ABC-type transport system involved in multi-copper enzyme maturation permease subunit